MIGDRANKGFSRGSVEFGMRWEELEGVLTQVVEFLQERLNPALAMRVPRGVPFLSAAIASSALPARTGNAVSFQKNLRLKRKMFSRRSADGYGTIAFTRRQLVPATSARLETHLKRSTRASERREPPPSGRSVLHRFPLKLRHLGICGRRPLPALSRKHRRRFPGLPTGTSMGTTNVARPREPGNGCVPPAVRIKSIVLRDNNPRIPSLRRASNKATTLRGRLLQCRQRPAGRQLTVTNSNVPSSLRPDKYKIQQLLADSSFKTRAFAKLHMVRRQLSFAASYSGHPEKNRESEPGVDYRCPHHHWLAVRVHRCMRRNAAVVHTVRGAHAGGHRTPSAPLSPLPWGHELQDNPVCLAPRVACSGAFQPSFETSALLPARLAACKLCGEEPRRLAHLFEM
ncbi:hypothetical protein HPB50_003874 [Hyalomma asiaticum]|uniref:Uncharacterized protein n=1 Tax=Hyalomma asiaticum TaxID=266040 RepID=A0ACB7RRT5_HYAAI|nr:hypothetical protein HPB50_003874 [Hyalomma asiaticum]